MGTATGWGGKFNGAPVSRVLKEVVIPIKNQTTCKMSTRLPVTSNMFCAGFGIDGVGEPCIGDGGGPLVVYNNGQWYLVGMTSFGEKCGQDGKYGFFTKVSNYITWIHTITKK